MIGNWTDIALQDIISYAIGGDWGYNPEESIDDSTLAYCIRGSEIKEWNKNRGKTAVIRRIKNSSLENRKLEIGDILLEISGGGPEQPVGRVLYIDEETIKTQDNHPIVCTNFFRRLHLNDTVCSRYVYYYLHFFYIIGNTISLQGGSNNLRNLKFKDYQLIRIPLPSLTEQKQIAEKLDKLFDQIETIKEASNKIPELLKNFRQQVLTYAVTGKLTEEWRKERQLDEWHTELAKDCCEKVQSGGTPKGGQFALSGIPFLKVYNIVGNKIDFESEPQYVSEEIQNSQIKKSITYPGDVIMNIVGPPLNKVAIIPDTYKEWNINQAITLFRPKEYLNNQYLYYFFCEGASVNSVLDKTRGVVGQVNISLSQCRDFVISIPPMEEQLEIVKRVQTLFDILDDVERRYNTLCEKLDKLPQALLCKAFKGELTK